ncbi:MAG: hypothetical protein LBN40_04440 [Oscillospiraceae bacterium]|nr:hypothetical protein [Oscillospiraceae bacterium]
MRCMSRNKVTFFYALYERKEAITDDYGNTTGEFEVIYGNPLEYSANISAAKGETQTRQFGENEVYDKVIVADNTVPPIDEYSVLWIDTLPQLDETGALATDETGKVITPYDYIVTKVARSLNSVSIAVSKVKVQ